MRYVRAPSELHCAEIRAEGFCFSPGRYVRFIPPTHSDTLRFAPLGKLVVMRNEVVRVHADEPYRYAEIGDIDVSTGGVEFRPMKGYQLPTKRPSRAKLGDVLISTVRTYRKGIGLVADAAEDLVTTGAVLNLCATTDFAPGISLPYVYGFLRSDFFVEQVWSLLNRGVYPRMDVGALDKISIPIADDQNTRDYVSALVLAISDKAGHIRSRSREILRQIDSELSTNQVAGPFRFEHPTLGDVRAIRRFDTGLYCQGFRTFRHRVDGYRYGSTTLSALGIRSRRGPNLAVSVIGRSLYSATAKLGWYQLIRPVNITEHGTLGSLEWLGSPKKLAIVNAGDLILGCEGFEKGRSLVLINAPTRCTTNFHGTVLSWPGAELWEMVFLRCFLAYLRQEGVIDWVGVGGSGGHMSPEYFDYLPIPCVPDGVRRQIASLYHNPSPPPPRRLTLENFVGWHREWNAALGVWELDRELKVLQQKLAEVQDAIIAGEPVRPPFEANRAAKDRPPAAA